MALILVSVEFHHRKRSGSPARLAVLPGSFNPPTIAHLELAQAAQSAVDEVVFVLPRSFPHKEYFGATLAERVELLIAADPQASIATTDGGLYIEIAREFNAHFGPETRIFLLCGRDAAERILTWDYGRERVVEEILAQFELLVAPRGGDFEPPPQFINRIQKLDVAPHLNDISSTELRERIARGDAWEHWVPENITERVRRIYS